MRNTVAVLAIVVGLVHGPARADDAPAVDVAAGESIQRALDAAPAGATVRVAAGVFRERLTIARPVTLVGAGWDQTIVEADAAAVAKTDAERIAFAKSLEQSDPGRHAAILQAYLGGGGTGVVVAARDVTLRGLAVRGAAFGPRVAAVVRFDGAANARVDACAILGPAQNGVELLNGGDAEVRGSLVAGVWHAGVVAAGTRGGARPSSVRLVESDVRNCYYAGVTLGGEGSSVERCRISGSAWHGIRYDGVSPAIRGNAIFGNARSGIYASGKTAATVTGNLFWRNEMDGISCWFDNADRVEGNTFVDNRREAVAVVGAARPTIARNVFVGNVLGITCGQVSGRDGKPAPGEPAPTIEANVFWRHDADVQRMGQPATRPAGNDAADPKFVAADRNDFALAADSPARAAGVGAADPLSPVSPWPIQPVEQKMIPDGETRDWNAWKKPADLR